MCLGFLQMFRPRASSPLVYTWRPLFPWDSPVQQGKPSPDQAPPLEPTSQVRSSPALPSVSSRGLEAPTGSGHRSTPDGKLSSGSKSPFDFVSPFDVLDQATRKVSRPASFSISPPQPSDSVTNNNTATRSPKAQHSSPSLTSPRQHTIPDFRRQGSDDSLPDPLTTQPWYPVAPAETSPRRRASGHAHHPAAPGAGVRSAESSAPSSPKPNEADDSASKASSEPLKGMARYYAAKAREAGSRLVFTLFSTRARPYVY
jgi:hypothetical protein